VSPWPVLAVLVALINLAALLAVRGRWGRMTWVLLIAALAGTAAGEAIGGLARLEVVMVGDFHVLAASIGAQLAMLVVLLGANVVPERTEG
jgi:hypothetical protein